MFAFLFSRDTLEGAMSNPLFLVVVVFWVALVVVVNIVVLVMVLVVV